MSHDLAAGIELVHPLGQIAQRDQMPAKVADLILVRLANVEHEKVFARIQTPLEFFDLYFRNACFCLLYTSTTHKKAPARRRGS